MSGDYIGDSDLGERMSCVGFCLNVLKGFLEEDYLSYSDWNAEEDDKEYLINFCKEHDLEIESIQPHYRRITPIECLSSCFFTELPISRTDIDDVKDDVEIYITSQLVN